MVIAGKEKGKRGRVLRVLTDKERVVVERVSVVKRHTKPTQANPRGGILEKEGPIHISNVALVCSECGPTRVQHRQMAEGKKVRVCVKCGKVLEK